MISVAVDHASYANFYHLLELGAQDTLGWVTLRKSVLHLCSSIVASRIFRGAVLTGRTLRGVSGQMFG